ncbi:MAG: HDIG domain-containing metalloprotein [Bacteroidota bacterium]
MPLLDRLGLAPKPGRYSRRAGLGSDARTAQSVKRYISRRGLWERVGLLASLAVIAMLAFPNVSVYDGSARVGEVWTADDIVAPFDFAIRLPDEVVEARRDSVRLSVAPVFIERPDALATTLARIDSVDARLDSAFVAYADWQEARSRLGQAQAAARLGGEVPEADLLALRRSVSDDSSRYAALRSDLSFGLTARQWQILLGSAYGVATGRTAGPPIDDLLFEEVERFSRRVVALDVPIDSVYTDELRVRNPDPSVRTEAIYNRRDVVGEDRLGREARRAFLAAFPGRPDTVSLGAILFDRTHEPALQYDAETTAHEREQEMASVQRSRGRVQQGQVVIRAGDQITQERFDQLQSLDLAQRDRSGDASWLRTIAGRLVLVLAALLLFFLYLYLLRPGIFYDTRRLLLVCLLLGAVLLGYLIAGSFSNATAYFVPVALASILLTIVFDSRVGSFATMTLAALGGLLFGYDFQFAFATLTVGVLAVFSVRDVKNRSQLAASAALVAVAYVLILSGYALLRADPITARFLTEVIGVTVNASLILLVAPLLWGIERTFGVTTDMTLLELSDTNRTLLKELSLRAPGTFNHSLQVANLAEAAADAIGANALRARVGALYHDIGKMLKPEYFIENQQPGENPHEKLKPSMSALVIAAHVKEGVQLGREQGLPEVVVDFIASHHGTGLIEFFYRRAQELDGEEHVDEADYRYPGPRPQTNEQAIVMLADSVEAASRSLDKPTPRRLQSLLDGIFASRVADGQLDESALTFADLARIKDTFHGLLCGIYHFRVKYPDQDEGPEAGGDGAPPATNGAQDGAVESERPTSGERSTLG